MCPLHVQKHQMRLFVRALFCINTSLLLSISHFFFFSSRRRHTRLQGDWSSDVCSSDLKLHRQGYAAIWRKELGEAYHVIAVLANVLRIHRFAAHLARTEVQPCVSLEWKDRKSVV